MSPGQHERPATEPDAPPVSESVGAAFARVVAPIALYGLDLAVHLVAVIADAHPLTAVTQGLLMPLLVAVVLGASHRPLARVTRWALLALALSWLGDVLPGIVGGDPDTRFLLMVGPFLLAQAAYVTAFWPDRRRVRVATVAVYAAALGALIVVCAPHAGTMLAPVLVYGATLTTMAVLSTGLGRVAALGGAVFFASDSLIALGHFAGHPAGTAGSVAVMATYAVGQALLAAGVLRRASDPERPSRARPSAPGTYRGAMPTTLPASHADLLDRPLFAHLATIRPDGSPQSSVMWFAWDGELLRFTHTSTRQKFKNLEHEPRVALSIADPDDQYRFLEIRGTVVSITPDDAEASFYHSLQVRYDSVYPIRDADVRVVVAVRPERFVAVAGGGVVASGALAG